MKRLIHGALAFLILMMIIVSSAAGTGIIYIDINSPYVRKLYLALPEASTFESASQEMKREVRETLTQDLVISDLFYLMEQEKFPQAGIYINEKTVDFKAWANAGAEFLLPVGLSKEGDKISLEFRLFDVAQKIYIAGKRYRSSTEGLRSMVHKMADEIIYQLSGERGIFQTKIAFVSDQTGNKEIYQMDFDGHTTEPITKNGSINISPTWSPDGKSILYTCFRRRNPDLYQVFLATGQTIPLSTTTGLNATSAWSPDGKQIALTMRGDGNTEIHILDPERKASTQLTHSWDNKVSPTWSPDGKQIAFVSDRSGSPQIYCMDLPTQKVRRLTYEGSYNCSPDWSPKGDRIAFAGREGGSFHIYTIRTDGTDLRRLTKEGNNEHPTWAPNGRHIVFASMKEGNYDISITTRDGGGPWKVTTSIANETEPAWSPWLPRK